MNAKTTQPQTDIQAAIEAGKALDHKQCLKINKIPGTVLPPDHTLILHPELMDSPQNTKETINTTTPESFIAYFNRFANKDSAVFCDLEEATFKGIIDYHGKATPQWCNHQLTYTCKKTQEWIDWKSYSAHRFNQIDFALFIESHLEEIQEPTAAEMLEISTSLRAKTAVNFSAATRLSNGQTSFTYSEKIEGAAGATGEIKIPEEITLGMRLFDGGQAYEIKAKFRYRINQGLLTMWYDLLRPEKVHQAAVENIFEQIKKEASSDLIIHSNNRSNAPC